MKFPWTIIVLVLLTVSVTKGHTNPNSKATENTTFLNNRLSDETVEERIAQLGLPFDAHTTPQIKSLIRRFTVEGQHDSEDILGRAKIYFPIFEHYLRMQGLPESLKFLPIVESSLRPAVFSPVGAAGLWQFVPVRKQQGATKILR